MGLYVFTPEQEQVNTTYYVASAPLGDDNNDGLTALTPCLTLEHIKSLLPTNIKAQFIINILDDSAPFELPNFTEFQYDGGIIYIRSIVDNTITTLIAGAASSAFQIAGLAIIANAYDGMFIEILDGAAVGDIRLIRDNTAVIITPTNKFSAAITPLTNFRVFRPSTTLISTALNSMVGLFGPLGPIVADETTGLVFERLNFDTISLRYSGQVHHYCCEMNDSYSTQDNSGSILGTIITGLDPRIPATLFGYTPKAYSGNGITYRGTSTIFMGSSISGSLCCIGQLFEILAGNLSVFGGNFTNGIESTNLRGFQQLEFLADTSLLILISKLTVVGPSLIFLSRVKIAASSIALTISKGAEAIIVFTNTITNSAGDAIRVESDALLFINGLATVTGVGGYGLHARFGGRIRIDGPLTNISGTLADLAVGNVPTTGTAASLAAAGNALLPAVTLDGSVIQRIS